jgi:hypothetical protein
MKELVMCVDCVLLIDKACHLNPPKVFYNPRQGQWYNRLPEPRENGGCAQGIGKCKCGGHDKDSSHVCSGTGKCSGKKISDVEKTLYWPDL